MMPSSDLVLFWSVFLALGRYDLTVLLRMAGNRMAGWNSQSHNSRTAFNL